MTKHNLRMIRALDAVFERRPAFLGGGAKRETEQEYRLQAMKDAVYVGNRALIAIGLANCNEAIAESTKVASKVTSWREMSNVLWLMEVVVMMTACQPSDQIMKRSLLADVFAAMGPLSGAVYVKSGKKLPPGLLEHLAKDFGELPRDRLCDLTILESDWDGLTWDGPTWDGQHDGSADTADVTVYAMRLPEAIRTGAQLSAEVNNLLRTCLMASQRVSGDANKLAFVTAAAVALMSAMPEAGMMDSATAAAASDVFRHCLMDRKTTASANARLCEELFLHVPIRLGAGWSVDSRTPAVAPTMDAEPIALYGGGFGTMPPLLLCLTRLGVAHHLLLPLARRLPKSLSVQCVSHLMAAIIVSRSTSQSREVLGRAEVELRIVNTSVLLLDCSEKVTANVTKRMENDELTIELAECCVCMAAAEDGARMLTLDCTHLDANPVDHSVCDECWERIVARTAAKQPLCPLCRRPARAVVPTTQGSGDAEMSHTAGDAKGALN